MTDGKHPLDRVLIPVKGMLYRRVFRGDQGRYLAFRNRVAQTAARARLYERESLSALAPFVGRGDIAIDVGASFGIYTSELARRVGASGQVHAFEPQRDVYAILVDRFRDNGNVHLVNAALADEPGSAEFVVPTIDSDIPETALGGLSRGTDGLAVAGDTPVTTLDAYCASFDRLAYIKVDAEGWDLDVLRGGRQTMRRLRPVVQVEVNDPGMLSDLMALAADVDYALEDRVFSGVNRLLTPR